MEASEVHGASLLAESLEVGGRLSTLSVGADYRLLASSSGGPTFPTPNRTRLGMQCLLCTTKLVIRCQVL